jgi:hypothetical protein
MVRPIAGNVAFCPAKAVIRDATFAERLTFFGVTIEFLASFIFLPFIFLPLNLKSQRQENDRQEDKE